MKFPIIVVIIFFAINANAQKSNLQNQDIESVTYSKDLLTPSTIILKEGSSVGNYKSQKAISYLFQMKDEELHFKNKTQVSNSVSIDRFERRIDNIRVPHGSYTTLVKDGRIQSIHAEHYDVQNMKRNKSLTEDQALNGALPQLGSDLFAWQSTAQLLSKFSPNSHQYSKLKKVLIEEFPKGELVYVKDYYNDSENLELAYLFTIESVVPEFRDRVYVSADDGRILLRDPQLKHGSGDTRYSGNRDFPTTEISGPPGAIYELKGIEAISGVICETRSLEGLGGLPVSSPAIVALSDSIADGDEPDPCLIDDTETIAEFGDDMWDANEHRKVVFTGGAQSCCPTYISNQCDEVKNDDIALDAHWGAATVARYWKDIHNRFGYDDDGAPINSYVHHGLSYENASWNGLIMKYGDGSFQDGNNPGAMFSPLVSLDVCAHEIGHAICTSTSDLVYVGESGAMNEGLSDIWGAAIEGYTLDSIDGSLDYVLWSIGEQIDERDGGLFDEPGARALRWMDHPPAENNPDTYGAGTWWQDPDCVSPSVANDFCGVHFNSGVLNKWFYLLTEGSGLALSPGLNKPAFDDEVNDKGDTYSVQGIGLRKSEKITFGANLLLSPNSRFVDMRAASIDIARSLYGPCSNEVQQTIRAWYAVGVGPDFGSCLPTIEFNQFNTAQILETSDINGCNASTEVSLSVFSYMANATVDITTFGNAIEGDDYELCFTSMTFSGDEEQQLKIIINDDKIEEGNDTIVVQISGGGFIDRDTIIILNDDGIPAIGSFDTLFHETFDTDDFSWQQELVNPISMINEWFIDAFNSDQAYISYTAASSAPTYTQAVESHVRLKSPNIDALGRKNVAVSFNYEVGGERDLVDPSAIFDFGTFEISYDGFEWEQIEVFVGDTMSGGTIIVTDTYENPLPQLDNSTFFLGFTWYNDALNGSAYSFMFDNVIVTGEGLEIESEIGDHMATEVPMGAKVGFISDTDNEIIAVIEDTKSDLGCTDISVSAQDLAIDFVPSICNFRSSKAFSISTELESDSIQLSLFFKESEIDEWDDFTSLNILAVDNSDIDDEHSDFVIIDNADIVLDDQTDNGDGFVTYTFWISSSFQSIALSDRPAIPQNLWVANNLDSGVESFRDIVQLACPEDTIRFLAATDNIDINLISEPVGIDKNLHIFGNGINATKLYNSDTAVINVLADIELSLSRLSIITENVTNAIINNGQVILQDSVLIR